MRIPRFLMKGFEGFKIIDLKEWLESRGVIEIYLDREDKYIRKCHCCKTPFNYLAGSKYALTLRHMPMMGYQVEVRTWRYRGFCPKCSRTRAEYMEIISDESPHYTKEYAWWLGRLFEMSAVKKVAEFANEGEMNMWRLDYARMKRMLRVYKIPEITHISVDEVYARKKSKYDGESRNEKFFTIICDLKTRRVIWVSKSRDKKALDEFFIIIGSEACKNIKIVCTDEHDSYEASVNEYCPNAIQIFDKFHILRNFEEAVNDTRKMIHESMPGGSEEKRLSRGKFRFVFLKRASQRTQEDQTHVDSLIAINREFAMLEIIKERFLSFFYAKDAIEAEDIFIEVGELARKMVFDPLTQWWKKAQEKLGKFLRYFENKYTSALSEGVNNVIKMIKRRAFGYRNMDYFKLKIMQVCGYLNSKYVHLEN